MTDRDIVNIYQEKNELTGKYRWQHMDPERMLKILKQITMQSRRKDDREAAAELALQVMKSQYK